MHPCEMNHGVWFSGPDDVSTRITRRQASADNASEAWNCRPREKSSTCTRRSSVLERCERNRASDHARLLDVHENADRLECCLVSTGSGGESGYLTVAIRGCGTAHVSARRTSAARMLTSPRSSQRELWALTAVATSRPAVLLNPNPCFTRLNQSRILSAFLRLGGIIEPTWSC
jgi:hypothetical protein